MIIVRQSYRVVLTNPSTSGRWRKRRSWTRGQRRVLGGILLGLAGLFAWATNGFHSEKSIAGYTDKELTYSRCTFERRRSGRSTHEELVFLTKEGRYIMERGVWRRHFTGPSLAQALASGATVHVWVRPDYPRVLRGLSGGAVEIPPQWGLAFDQRNRQAGLCMDVAFIITGVLLLAL